MGGTVNRTLRWQQGYGNGAVDLGDDLVESIPDNRDLTCAKRGSS
jgi:hypothetical protein